MFDPAKLSPLPLAIETDGTSSLYARVESEPDVVLTDALMDDAEFFVMARKCFDIGERRGWHIAHDLAWYVDLDYHPDMPVKFEEDCKTQAEAMALMIEADKWLTKQETEGNSDER